MTRSTMLSRSIRRRFLGLTALLALALTGACGKDEGAKPAAEAKPATKPAPKPAPPAPTTKPFHDETHGFTVEHARTPTRSEQQVPTALGPVTAHSYMFSAPSAPGAMMVMVTPDFYDPAQGLDLAKMLEDSQAGSMATMNGTVIESAAIDAAGGAGRWFRFKVSPQGKAATGYSRLYLHGGSLYQVMVVGLNSAKDFQAQGTAFVDSFRLDARTP